MVTPFFPIKEMDWVDWKTNGLASIPMDLERTWTGFDPKGLDRKWVDVDPN